MGKVKIILIKNITIEITNTEKEIYDVIQNSIKITEEKISLICDQIYQTKNFAEIRALEKRLPRLKKQSKDLLRESWKIIRRNLNNQLKRKNKHSTM